MAPHRGRPGGGASGNAVTVRMLARLRTLWRLIRRRGRSDPDVHDELGAYVDLVTDEKIAAGMSPDEARRAARLETGNLEPIREEMRDLHPGAFLDRLRQDVRGGMRLFARTRGVTVAIVLTLALAIGAASATFAVVDGVLLQPLPYPRADELVVVMHSRDQPVAPANFLDWQREASALAPMGAAEYWTPSASGTALPEKLFGLRMTADVLPLVGVAPAIGGFFGVGAYAGRDIVIGDSLWHRLFAADPAVVGRQIQLDGHAYRIVGVMPPGFQFAPFWATRAELWAPLDLSERRTHRRSNSLRVFARLAPGANLDRARREIGAITGRLESEYPGSNRDVTVTPLKDMVVGDVRDALVLLFAAVCLVLLIACANVSHMLLARSATRDKEVAIRAALGAGRARLVRQMLTESLLLASAGGTAGLCSAVGAVEIVRRLAASSVPRVQAIGIDARVVAFTAAIALGTSSLIGLLPALRSARTDLSSTLRAAERGSTVSRRSRRMRAALVVSEVALAVTLLVAAGLLIRSFAAIRRVDPGFEPDRLISMVVSVAGTAEAAPDRRFAFYQQVRDAISAIPGVQRVGAINHVPLVGDIWGMSYIVEGRAPAPAGEAPTATYRVVLPGYFETIGQRLLAGRDLTDADRAGAAPVVIVNESLAQAAWPGRDPLGRRIKVMSGGDVEWRTVVGVAAHAVRSSWREAPAAEVYLPLLQSTPHRVAEAPHLAYLSYVIRTSGDPTAVAPLIRPAVRDLAPAVPVSEVAIMADVVNEATRADRFVVTLLAVFAAIALVLAAVGIYGVMSFVVAVRRQEIGIRLALGAAPRALRWTIVRNGLIVAGLGASIGIVGAVLARGTLAGLLYGIEPLDAPTFAGVVLLVSAVAAAASYLPARRASRIDPAIELR